MGLYLFYVEDDRHVDVPGGIVVVVVQLCRIYSSQWAEDCSERLVGIILYNDMLSSWVHPQDDDHRGSRISLGGLL